MITVRRIDTSEAEIFKRLRLAALQESPNAFSSSYNRAKQRSHESWEAQVDSVASGDDRATFIALDGGQPIGLMSLYRDARETNTGELIQVWIEPRYRGNGVSKNLIEGLFDWADKTGFSSIRTWVSTDNLRAITYYEKHGFELTDKIEAMAKEEPQTIQLMVKDFDNPEN